MGIEITPTDEGTRVKVTVPNLGSRTLHAIGDDEEKALKIFQDTYKMFCSQFDFEDLAHQKKVSELDLPGRALTAFESEGITLVEDIPRDIQTLTTIEGMGKTSAKAVLEAIEKAGEPMELEDPYIGSIGITGRAFGALWRAGIKRVSEIPRSEEQLSAIDGCGKGSVKAILKAVS